MSKKLLRTILIVLLIGGIALAMNYRDQLDAEQLSAWVASFGVAGPLVFMLLYALATVLFLPGSVLTLAGGAIFGPLWGTLYNLTGATLGATLAFLVSRYLAADWAEQKSGGRTKQLKDGVEAEGWRFVAFVRLVPLFPFNILNYALGLTRIKLSHYIITSYICMLPGGFAYTYLGYAGREAVAGGEGLIQKGLLALALLAVVSFLPRLIGRLRQGPKDDSAES
ncbi:MAG: TVP38/TMEM64 family protein [Pseudomonadota bacterium]